jgi:hypothetical protein
MAADKTVVALGKSVTSKDGDVKGPGEEFTTAMLNGMDEKDVEETFKLLKSKGFLCAESTYAKAVKAKKAAASAAEDDTTPTSSADEMDGRVDKKDDKA